MQAQHRAAMRSRLWSRLCPRLQAAARTKALTNDRRRSAECARSQLKSHRAVRLLRGVTRHNRPRTRRNDRRRRCTHLCPGELSSSLRGSFSCQADIDQTPRFRVFQRIKGRFQGLKALCIRCSCRNQIPKAQADFRLSSRLGQAKQLVRILCHLGPPVFPRSSAYNVPTSVFSR